MQEQIINMDSTNPLNEIRAIDINNSFIDNLYSFAVKGKEQATNNLEDEWDEAERCDSLSKHDKESYKDSLIDENYDNEQTMELVQEVLIIAFYKTLEIQLKNIMDKSELFSKTEIKNSYIFDKLKDAIKTKVHCDIELLTHYDSINELLLINNCIKHNDSRVDAKLSKKYSKWVEGSKLKNLVEVYNSLRCRINIFMNELKDIMIKHLEDQKNVKVVELK